MEKVSIQQKSSLSSPIGAWLERRPGYGLELAFQSIASLMFNSTLISLPLVGLSFWLRRVSLKDIGLARPYRGGLLLVLSLAASLAWAVLDLVILTPALTGWLGSPLDLSALSSVSIDVASLAGWLVYAWVSAALGEELIFRGYFLTRFAGLWGNRRIGWCAGLLVSSTFFGFAHAYQGLAGAIGKFFFGLFLGGLALANRRSLWMSILVHGFVDTLGFLALFLGWIH